MSGEERRQPRRWLAGQARRLRSAVRARQARQAQLGDVERAERDRLSRLARARAEGVQQRLHERFPRMPVRFAAPVAEVAARPRIDDLATHAGALTYGSFLAIPPLLLFASAVVGFVLAGHPETAQKAVDELVSLVPGLGSVVTAQVQAAVDGRVTLGALGLIGLLWSASGYASRMRHALGIIFRTEWAGLLTGRIRGAVIGFLMVAAFVGLAIFAWVETRLQAASRSSAASVLQAAGFAGGGFLIFLITYRVLTPGTGVRLRDHVPGAVTFTIAWLALTAVGGLVFTQLIENSTALYGAIGGIFGLLAFLYAANWSLLIGAELSAVLMGRRRSMRATRSGSR